MQNEFKRLNHVAVLVRDLPAAITRYVNVLGGVMVSQGYVQSSGADVAVVELGGLHIELLSASQPDSKVAKLLDQLGEGIHHVSFQVENLEASLLELKEAGIRLRDHTPRPGLHGRRIAFLDPQDTCGALIELVEENVNEGKQNERRD